MDKLEFIFNDGGRKAAGYKGNAGDCVVRAIAILTGRSYKDVYTTLAQDRKRRGWPATGNAGSMIRKARSSVTGKTWRRADNDAELELFGLKKVSIPKGELPTYTEAYARYGDCLVTTNGHIACLKDGALQDTFNGLEYRWQVDDQPVETKARKARSVWVKKS